MIRIVSPAKLCNAVSSLPLAHAHRDAAAAAISPSASLDAGDTGRYVILQSPERA
jgi:hypothetical protein